MKKQLAMVAICAALLMCVAAAGCTSSTSSSPNASAAANSSSQAATAAPTATPTPTSTPSARPSNLTVLFFYKPGCPHCAALENTSSFAQLQREVTVQWIVSAQSPLTDQYGVTSDPTLILLNHGTEVGRWVDATEANGINAQIASLLNPS
jgi:thiol-disulfide isomerase/thioredoxin